MTVSEAGLISVTMKTYYRECAGRTTTHKAG
jgi:hypothetical protein